MSQFKKWKLLIIIVLFFVISILGAKCYEYYNAHQKHQQALLQRQQYLEALACVPKQPIDQKTLFANVMKQYWQYRIKALWTQDEALKDWLGGIETNLVQSSCGLEEPYRMTQETCYPWQVPYKNLEELYLGLTEDTNGYPLDKNHNRFTNRMFSLNAKAYHPDWDKNIYLDSSKPFSIIKRESNRTVFYPPDCCTIYSYEEMKQKNLLDKVLFGEDPLFYNEILIGKNGLIDENVLKKLYFLKVEYYFNVDSCNYDRGVDGCIGSKFGFHYDKPKGKISEYIDKKVFFEDIDNTQRYMPISQCGVLSIFQPPLN